MPNMNEKQTKAIRPTKKQKQLLGFIEGFIAEHGYSPSYREIMAACNYSSIATVAVHIENLIKRGHLQKRDHSARSLEVVKPDSNEPEKVTSNQVTPGQEKWLVERIEHSFQQAESASAKSTSLDIDNLAILVAALKVLGLDGAAQSFTPRLAALKKRQSS